MKKTARNRKSTITAPPMEKFQVIEGIQAVQISSEERITSKHVVRFYKKTSFKVIGFFLVLIVIGVLVYLQVSSLEDAPINAEQNAQKEVKELVTELGKIMLIPEGEVPQIATVADITKLTEQPFFKNAQNGDKVVIFQSRKEAILYRPSVRKIITMTPMNDQLSGTSSAQNTPQPTTAVSVTPVIAQKARVMVVNSTQTAGLARKGGALLNKDKYTVTTGNAREEYAKSTISVVSKDVKSMSAFVADLSSVYSKVKPSVVPLPAGEIVPAGVDIVVILGNDFVD